MELAIPFVCIGNSLSVVGISGKPKTKRHQHCIIK